MVMFRRLPVVLVITLGVALLHVSPRAQNRAASPPAAGHQTPARLTTPMAEWGHDIGDDYFLVNYQQLIAYWKKLEKESPRIARRGDRQDAPTGVRC